jgi:uncharacterized protein
MLHRLQRTAQTLLAGLVAALFLAGCAPGLLDHRAAELELRSAEAREFEQARDWRAAAEAWQQAAEAGRGADRDRALLAAANAWLRADRPERARAALAGVSTDPGPGLAARKAVAEARLLLRDERPAEALERLAGLPTGPNDPEAAAILAVRGDAAFANGEPARGVAALARRESLLEDPAQRTANQRRIWNRMQEASAAGISLDAPPGMDRLSAAWLELGRLAAESGGNLFHLSAGLMEWRERHPSHPAAPDLVEHLLGEFRAMTEYPQRIALLLPLGGTQAGAAAAVRDGFIAAWLEHGNGGERPVLRVYDTTALGATGAFELAARNGADFIVGPLLKEDLAELSGAMLPAVPSLALNWADPGSELPAWMYQFSLAPEEEAVAAALRAARDGHRRAVVLAPDTDAGRRMANSFAAAFSESGGEVLGSQLYDARDRDFSVEITALLLINESRARHQQLQRHLGRSLEFEPRRRQDADLLFLAARAGEAVLIRPQLRFHFASELPIYATSSIYDPGRADNSDLDGVLFADMPWRVGARDVELMQRFDAFGAHALERSGRLFAFGLDAYRLVPLLHNRSGALGAGIEGVTGALRLADDGRLLRQPEWGRFQRGQVSHAAPRELLLEETGLIDALVLPGS